MDSDSLLDIWRFLIIKGLEFCCAQFTSFILNGTGSMLAPVNLQPADIVCYLSNGPSLNKWFASVGVAEEKPRPQMFSC